MKPIAPKFRDRVSIELNVTPKTREVLAQYSKFTKYSESEIVDQLVLEILDDDQEFVSWLKKRRYRKRIEGFIFNETETPEGFESDEDTIEISPD